MRWQYGLWPLRNVVKKTVEDPSIFKYGVSNYLKEIENAQKANPDMVIIGAVESAPLYYWQGGPFHNNLKIINWHKHMLAIGLDKKEDYEMLPVISNTKGLALPFKPHNIFYFLLPLITLIFGVLCIFSHKFGYKRAYGRALGVLLVLAGILFLWNDYPFRDMRFDQYHGDMGIKPYQNYIDYVNSRGGLSFWAHPEAEYLEKIRNVDIETREHAHDLLSSDRYTGFALFYEGYKKSGIPGGIWDQVLMQYCKGVRKNPVWALACLGFDNDGMLDNYLQDLRTVLLVSALDKRSVLEALKQGRAYLIRGRDSSSFVLDKFGIQDSALGPEKTFGQQAMIKNKARIEISGHFTNGQSKTFNLRLVKNGAVIKTFEISAPFDIVYEDPVADNPDLNFYRVDAETDGVHVVTNPVFVKKVL